MNPQTLNWFAASATILASVTSLFQPGNTFCPVNLSPKQRVLLCMVLGAVVACLHQISTGANPIESLLTAAGAVMTALFANGNGKSLLDAAVVNPPKTGGQ